MTAQESNMGAPRAGARWWLLAASVTPALFFAYGGYLRRWAGDDGYINLRVVQQLMAGNGFVYNVGERCEAVTSALWILVLWALGELGLNLESATWISALLLGASGVGLAAWATSRLSEADPRGSTLVLPFAALAYVAIPVAWDYATSALENSLGLAYLGGSYFLLARRLTAPSSRLPVATALALGLGPLVRPDYALYAGPLLLILLASESRWKARIALAALGALPGATFQVFRMGYFAALVPNTAIAKEAFESRWEQGYLFLKNTFVTYWLAVPLAVVLLQLVDRLGEPRGSRPRLAALLPLALAGAGVLHILYVVRVGGDFMHGRMLLPGLFAVFASSASLRVRAPFRGPGLRDFAAFGVLAAWAVVCATWLRPEIFEYQVLDERLWYSLEAKHPNPTHIEHYTQHKYYGGPLFIKGRIAEGCPRGVASLANEAPDVCKRVVLADPIDGRLSDRPEGELMPMGKGVAPSDAVAVYSFRPLGLAGQAVGLRVNIVDSFGLADPLAARVELLERGRPGHEKTLSTVWFAAKYSAEDATADERVVPARRALACGLLKELHTATHAPLTLSRFVANLGAAFPLHTVRVPADPHEAVARFCLHL